MDEYDDARTVSSQVQRATQTYVADGYRELAVGFDHGRLKDCLGHSRRQGTRVHSCNAGARRRS